MIDAVTGAAVVSRVPAAWMRLALTPCLIGTGLLLLLRGRRRGAETDDLPRAGSPLGLVAGFTDAVAGDG